MSINGFDFEIDKCREIFQIRIPDLTKELLDKLSKSQKKDLNDEILILIARHLHMANFKAKDYLVSE